MSATLSSGTISAGGAALYYERSGAGPAVVLMHAFALDRRMWDDQMPVLERRFEVIRYDLRGFGKSTPGPEPYSHAADLLALMNGLGVEQAALIGLSLGGGAAINFAILHPERVRALAVAGPSLGGYAWSAETNAAQVAVREAATQGGAAAARGLWRSLPRVHVRAGHESAQRYREIVQDYSGWHWLHPKLGQSMNPPAIKRLSEVKAPTLVMVGEHDMADFQNIAATLAAGIPGARKVVVPDAGHMINAENPEFFNREVEAFLLAMDGAGQ